MEVGGETTCIRRGKKSRVFLLFEPKSSGPMGEAAGISSHKIRQSPKKKKKFFLKNKV